MTKILIVDDDENLLRLYSAILRKEGHEVLTASAARKALDIAIAEKPNLILLDVMMPSLDGGSAAGFLSEHVSTREIPVIFLTSLVSEDEVDAAHGKIGGRDYISKSTPMPKFVATVKAALARGSGSPL
ncbi:MAG: response regulator [Thermoanaerobaculia bacterium]